MYSDHGDMGAIIIVSPYHDMQIYKLILLFSIAQYMDLQYSILQISLNEIFKATYIWEL